MYLTGHNEKFVTFERIALRKLDMINAAVNLNTLRIPQGNHLEQLKGDRLGQHSIRINDKYRICFKWFDENAYDYDVEIVNYYD